MKPATRTTILGILGVIAIAAIAGNIATGGAAFTHEGDSELAEMNDETGLGDLFGDADEGADPAVEPETIESGFQLGWLPSGPGLGSVSVMTIAGPMIAAAVGLVLLERRASRRRAVPTTA